MVEKTGFFLYDGKFITQQVNDIKYFFEYLLKEENFDTIIELGTSFGGLTCILDDIIKENKLTHNIHTFDIGYKEYVESELNSRSCYYYILDELNEEYKDKVKHLLSYGGKCLLLCDGGYKIDEFNRYSEFLKKDDIIMAHDYCENEEIFESEIKEKFWNWLEIKYENIKKSVEIFNLEKYSKVDMKNAAWACYQKK